MAAWAPRLRPIAWQVLLALLLTQGVVDLGVKPFVARPRPFVAAARRASSVTIARRRIRSRQAMPRSSFAAATVLAFGVPRLKAVWFALAALIAFSRVYIGVHYPLDVTCGALLGVAVGVLVSGGRAWYSRGSSFSCPRRAEVAQLVEHTTENRSVGSSILPLGTINP